MNRLSRLLTSRRVSGSVWQSVPLIIGMVHLMPLPSSPQHDPHRHRPYQEILHRAYHEATIYHKWGVDALLIENMGDVPYTNHTRHPVEPSVVSSMALVSHHLRQHLPPSMPIGIQILAGGNEAAVAVASSCDLDFIRAESFVFSHVADEGWMDAQAANLLRYRRRIHAEHVSVLCDVKKKHAAHVVTQDVDVVETALAAQFFKADGVILTGTKTAHAADVQELSRMKAASCSLNIPVFVGSGVTVDNVQDYMAADALIIGSHFKQNGHWEGDLCENRLKLFFDKIHCLAK